MPDTGDVSQKRSDVVCAVRTLRWLHNQNRTHFAWFVALAGVQVDKPDPPLSTRRILNRVELGIHFHAPGSDAPRHLHQMLVPLLAKHFLIHRGDGAANIFGARQVQNFGSMLRLFQ